MPDVGAQRYWISSPHTPCLELEETPTGDNPSKYAYHFKIPFLKQTNNNKQEQKIPFCTYSVSSDNPSGGSNPMFL